MERDAKGTAAKDVAVGAKIPKNANDHEQGARVHPAQPIYSVVVPASELLSVNVAVQKHMGTPRTFRKGALAEGAKMERPNWPIHTHLTTLGVRNSICTFETSPT